MTETWTILSLLNWTNDYFNKKGILSARLDAELLLAFSLNCKRIELYTQFDRPLSSTELAQYKKLIERRAKREPLAYILGYKEFYSLPFLVTPAVLIPRPETEIMIDSILEEFKNNLNAALTILDLGLGSGCILATLCKHLPHSKGFGFDKSEAALNIAAQNMEQLQLSSRLQLYQADFSRASTYENLIPSQSIDIVTSNPPYVPFKQLLSLEPELHYEPKEALSPGESGLESYEQVLECANYFLKDKGQIWLELGEGQADAIITLLKNKGFTEIKRIQDYQGIDRILVAKKKSYDVSE